MLVCYLDDSGKDAQNPITTIAGYAAAEEAWAAFEHEVEPFFVERKVSVLHTMDLHNADREFNMIAAWSADRLGRSLQHLVSFLTELRALGCDLYLHQQVLDTSTPSGRTMFQMCGVFAEFERGMIRERVNAGLARAKERGTKLGRRPIKASVEGRIRELRAKGMGILKIGRTLGVGTSVVQRVLTALAA